MIIILTPSRDGMVHHSHIAAIEAMERVRPVQHRVYQHLVGCSLVPHARNVLTTQALDVARDIQFSSVGYPHLLWLDSDTVLEPNDLSTLCGRYVERLLSGHENKIGLYSAATPLRPIPGGPREHTPEAIDTGGSDAVEVNAVGLACTIMSAGLLRDVWQAADPYVVRGETYREVFAARVWPDGIYRGEDVALSAWATRHGYTNYVDTAVLVGHLGHTIARY